MLVVETIAKIRRAHFVGGKSIKSIASERGISRNAVRKVLRSDETAFQYERTERRYPQLGAYVVELEALLEANVHNARRERLTVMRMYELLGESGYPASYDAVRRYARRWQREHGSGNTDVFVPLSFALGEAYQFD